VKASLGEVRLEETEGGGSKEGSRKETRGKREEKVLWNTSDTNIFYFFFSFSDCILILFSFPFELEQRRGM